MSGSPWSHRFPARRRRAIQRWSRARPHTGQRCCARMAKDQMSHKGVECRGRLDRPGGRMVIACAIAAWHVPRACRSSAASRPKVRQPGIADSPVARFRGDGTLRSWQRHRGADRWTRRIQVDRTPLRRLASGQRMPTPAMETAGEAHPLRQEARESKLGRVSVDARSGAVSPVALSYRRIDIDSDRSAGFAD